MMKKMILITMAFCFVTICLMGCTKQSEKMHVAIINGDCANSAPVNENKALDYITKACESFGSVSIIVPDGKPFQSANAKIPDQNEKGLSESKRQEIARTQAKQIVEMLNESHAVNEEVDLLTAFHLAGRSLNASEDGKKEILVLHSGLATQGMLDFTKGYLGSSSVDDILLYLKEEQAIPNLNGIHIIWTGLGDTQAPQPDLSAKNKSYLMEVWNRILTEAGAQVDFVSDLPIGNNPDQVLPHVSVVEILQPASAISEVVSDNSKVEETIFVLDEETIHFKPGSAELLSNEQDVIRVLHDFITYMIEHPSYQILLAGTTASAGKQEELIILSNKRCNTIKKLFLNAGVREDQIQTIGLGFENHPYYILDITEKGELIENIAKKNRSVIILPLHSNKADALLNNH